MLSPNTILRERYRIIHQLGHGGMGAVYQALDENLSCVIDPSDLPKTYLDKLAACGSAAFQCGKAQPYRDAWFTSISSRLSLDDEFYLLQPGEAKPRRSVGWQSR